MWRETRIKHIFDNCVTYAVQRVLQLDQPWTGITLDGCHSPRSPRGERTGSAPKRSQLAGGMARKAASSDAGPWDVKFGP
ncbi:hypothetical protein NJB1907Z4_C23130 [Mycobacterium pseudoshottsii]|uniref:Uncharacterized protein n=1 Tax=Mycobacterium pseudoshottsii TaxID=265949 RepID=A0A9N7LR72_9MYCO|nr:hypothetical protein NJB1907Z4_C23130 [Mycobacterium pseudoshottsii]